jgi:hypothetical protein
VAQKMDALIDNFCKEPNCKTLEKLLQGHTGEDGEQKRLDFKRAMPPKRESLAKILLAMANSGGGVIILGVDEKEDGTFDPIGLPKVTDKSKIKVQKYLPDELKLRYDVIDLLCKAGDSPLVRGKKFQAIIVKDEPLFVPYTAQADGDGIYEGTIYVRRLSESVSANTAELKDIFSRRISSILQHELTRQELRSAGYPRISAADKQVLRGALYDEIITAAEKIELIQFGACVTIKTDSNNDYIRSEKKLGDIAPIEFPVYSDVRSRQYIPFSQLEDKKELVDICEDLERDKRVLETFGATIFDSEDKAIKTINEARLRFRQQTVARIERSFERHKSFLKQLDNWASLEKRWDKIKVESSRKFPCSDVKSAETHDAPINSQKMVKHRTEKQTAMHELEILYDRAKTTLDQATDALKAGRYRTYPTYVNEYNSIVELVTKRYKESPKHFEVIDAPAPSIFPLYEDKYLSTVALKLNLLVKYLQDRLETQKKSIPASSKPSYLGIEKERVFVIMSMDKEDSSLEDVHHAIKRVCKSFSLHAERSDDIEHSGSITNKIKERIKAAGTLVADLSYDRPNVYYELGYAHGLGRDEEVILLAKEHSKLHFDIKDFNIIFYKNITELETKLKKRLGATLKSSDVIFPS